MFFSSMFALKSARYNFLNLVKIFKISEGLTREQITGAHKASILTDSLPISAFNFKIHNIYQ